MPEGWPNKPVLIWECYRKKKQQHRGFHYSSPCVLIILSSESKQSLLGGVAKMSFFTTIFRLQDTGHVSLKKVPDRGPKTEYRTWSVPTVWSLQEKEENDIG